MKSLASLLSLAVVLTIAGVSALAKEPAASQPAALKAVLVANKDTYVLDPAIKGKAFRDKVEAAKKKGEAAPAPAPKVDLTLKITNTSDKPVTLSIGGDQSRIELKLEGPGAISMPNQVMMTMEFRPGTPVTIAPGKSHEIDITSLSYGARGVAEVAYWTEPGDYTLSATLTAAEGEHNVTVASEPVKVKVTEK